MSIPKKLSTFYLVVLSITTSLVAKEADDFLRFLEARDESIASYEIKLRQFTFDIPLEDFVAFKKDVQQLAKNKTGSPSPLQQAEQLIQIWAKKHHWLERHTKQRGEHFKEKLAFFSGGTSFTSYDGRLYYRYVVPNRQLDIHAERPNVHHTNIGDLGFASGWLRRGKILSFEQNAEGVRCVILLSQNDPLTVTQQYNRNFGLYHEHLIDSRQQSDYFYYLFHEEIDGYSVPHLKINISPIPRRNECSVWMLVIEDVKFNLPLTDEDLSIPDIPADTLVIDYRFKPEIQWRYGEYCQAAANPDGVHAGHAKPEGLLEFLTRNRGRREALATRDSRIGRKAPRPSVQRWLSEADNVDVWPPKKFTVVNFWSMGCGFCVGEVPENNELARWLKDRGGLFFSLHAARKEYGAITDFMENHEVQYLVGLDTPGGQRHYWGSATFAEYGVNSVPSYILVNENGDVIGYERTVTKQMLEKLVAKEPDQIAASAKGDVRQRLEVIPKGWLARDLEPNSQIQGRFFVFRPETPDPNLHELEGPGRTIDCQWTRYSADDQTVYEVVLTAKTPDWGQTLKGDVAWVVRPGNVEEMVNIPYELRSRNLAECVSDTLWLGPVEKGKAVSREIVLYTDPGRNVVVQVLSVPSDFKVHVPESGRESNRILAGCVFHPEETGLRRGTATLLARDGKGNEQTLRLDYCAFVRP